VANSRYKVSMTRETREEAALLGMTSGEYKKTLEGAMLKLQRVLMDDKYSLAREYFRERLAEIDSMDHRKEWLD